VEHDETSRRDLLLASLLTAVPFGISQAGASTLNPQQTIIKKSDQLEWKASPSYPEKKCRPM
jgi:hypothetical protein